MYIELTGVEVALLAVSFVLVVMLKLSFLWCHVRGVTVEVSLGSTG